VHYHRTESDLHIKVMQSAPGWKLILEPPRIEGAQIQVLQGTLEGADKTPIIVTEGKELEVKLIKNN